MAVDGHHLEFITAKNFESDAHSYSLTVRASDGANTTDLAMTVTLTDQNDNAPVFTSTATPSVPENTTAVVNLTATDADTVGGPVTFTIVAGGDAALFQMAVDGHHLEFITAKNFESDAHSYSLTVRASDGANTTDLAMTVTLTDQNDSPPIFTSTPTPSVPENTTAVVNLTATDADTVGGPVTFTIVPGGDAALFQMAVDGHHLEFITAKNFESDAHSYSLTVRASDGANTTDLALTVTLTDQNHNAPVFTSTATPSVTENTTAVVNLTATDAGTVGGPVTFTIVAGGDAALFQLVVDGHHLEFITAKDFEADAHSYSLTVRASDGANTTDLAMTVTLTPVNDNAPSFTSADSVNVPENTTAVLTVHATDADVPAQTVGYGITGGADAVKFTVNPVSGALSFLSAPDYDGPSDVDGNNVYVVEVTANDGAGNTTSQTISVTVTPVNDNAPSFTSADSVNVPENTTAVLTVHATDADAPSQTVGYGITGGADAVKFTINPVSGALSFLSAPDYESPSDADGNNVYVVEATANDGAGNTTSQTISVTVTPMNDNPPSFTSTDSVNVPENTTAVLTVHATDADVPTQTVGYAITGERMR